jgi:hypothetical protein
MREKWRARRPSPAMIVSIIALVFALAGTGVASVATISALSKKDKKKVKNIANNQINQRAPGLSVASAKNADNAANATNATNATNANAVDGMSGATFKRTYTTTTAFENVLTIDGLTIRARCVDAGGVNPDELDLEAVSGAENSEVSMQSVSSSDGAETDIDLDFDAGDTFDLVPFEGNGSGSVVYSTDGGSIVTVNYYGAEVIFGLGCQTAGVGFGNS